MKKNKGRGRESSRKVKIRQGEGAKDVTEGKGRLRKGEDKGEGEGRRRGRRHKRRGKHQGR